MAWNNERTWANRAGPKYAKTVYVDIDTGEVLEEDFKNKNYYELKESYKNENNGIINTTRCVKLKGRINKQLTLF